MRDGLIVSIKFSLLDRLRILVGATVRIRTETVEGPLPKLRATEVGIDQAFRWPWARRPLKAIAG